MLENQPSEELESPKSVSGSNSNKAAAAQNMEVDNDAGPSQNFEADNAVEAMDNAEEVRPNIEEDNAVEAIENVEEDNAGGAIQNSEVDIVAVTRPSAHIITIYESDLRCLDDEQFLNDNIIDSYLNFVQYNKVPPYFRRLTHMFSASFNKYLMKYFEVKEPNKKQIFESSEKWCRSVDIFSKDFIFLPVNRGCHWFLAVLCYFSQTKKVLEALEHSPERDLSGVITPDERAWIHPYIQKRRNRILLFDSLRLVTPEKDRKALRKSLNSFLQLAYFFKYGKVVLDFKVPCHVINSPQQHCVYDCGVYVIQCVERFFELPISFDNLSQDLSNWFTPRIIPYKREQIRRVLSSRIIAPESTSSSSSDDIILLGSGD